MLQVGPITLYHTYSRWLFQIRRNDFFTFYLLICFLWEDVDWNKLDLEHRTESGIFLLSLLLARPPAGGFRVRHGLPSLVCFRKSDILKWLPTCASLPLFKPDFYIKSRSPRSPSFDPFRPIPLSDFALSHSDFQIDDDPPVLPHVFHSLSVITATDHPSFARIRYTTSIPSVVRSFARIPRFRIPHIPFISSSSQSALEGRLVLAGRWYLNLFYCLLLFISLFFFSTELWIMCIQIALCWTRPMKPWQYWWCPSME